MFKFNKKLFTILLSVVSIFLSFPIIFLFFFASRTFYSAIETITFGDYILYLTLLALVISTFISYKLHHDNKEIRDADYMPFILITSVTDLLNLMQEKRGAKKESLEFKNIGRGHAFHVQAELLRSGYWEAQFGVPVYLALNDNSSYQLIPSLSQYFDAPKICPDKFRIRAMDVLGNEYIFEYRIENLNEAKYFRLLKNGKLVKEPPIYLTKNIY